MSKYGFSILIFSVLILWQGCRKDDGALPQDMSYELALPPGFPMPDIPEDNLLTLARVALGRELFYDPILSQDSTVSCASCHKQSLAFADSLPISPGVGGRLGLRNSPTLANVAYLEQLNKDGGVAKLGLQPIVPIEDHNEMNLSILEAARRLNRQAAYRDLFRKAYADEATPFTITRGLASFMRTMISGNSRYDRYRQGEEGTLSEGERKGMLLFGSARTKCSGCHAGFNFTDNSFRNNGLYDSYQDPGRMRVTGLPQDEGSFRVPTLRNIALTAPYMHDGSLPSLRAVIEHYDSGGSNHPNKSRFIEPLGLSEEEKENLILFLEALTDSSFITNPAFIQ